MTKKPSTLRTKLLLALFSTGLLGTILVAILLGFLTRRGFNTFLERSAATQLNQTLVGFYQSQGSWEGLVDYLPAHIPNSLPSDQVLVLNHDGVVVYSMDMNEIGDQYPEEQQPPEAMLKVDDRVIGFIMFDPFSGGVTSPGPILVRGQSPENRFRNEILSATLYSAGIAALLAIALALILSNSLSKPIQSLTQATERIAAGKFGHTIDIKSNDELGTLGKSFNQMSLQLDRLDGLRKQLTADIAHELRTPLTILGGYTEGLKNGMVEATPKLFNLMDEEVQLLTRLVEELRTLSLADAGHLVLNKRPVDPKALLERSLLAHFQTAEKQSVQLRIEAADDLPSVAVDPDRFAQVLNNLVSNALRHTATGTIALSAQVEGDEVRLGVRDTGKGIPEEDLPYVFERFFRGDSARTRDGEVGSGLGLAIARSIVEAHAGRIEVESMVGQGTSFMIYLSKSHTE